MYNYPTDLIRIEQASEITGLSKSYIYKLSCRWWIPMVKKKNELWFSISELKGFNEDRRQRVRSKSIS